MIPLKDNIPSRKFPLFNYFLIFANTIIFFYEIFLPKNKLQELFLTQGFIPYYFFKNPINNLETLITSIFLHGGWIHFLGNMLYLYIFGDNVEDLLGHFSYLIFYFSAGIIASLTQALFSFSSKIPMIGASGAIAGVLGIYFIFFPFARVLTLVPFFFFWQIVPVPAFLFLFFWFFIQFFSGIFSLGINTQGGVAFFAHIGGFLYGVFIGILIRKRKIKKYLKYINL
ncbi:MAG: rhomboid family intramembrane serine protease [candidate division WOR-3 bacterium]